MSFCNFVAISWDFWDFRGISLAFNGVSAISLVFRVVLSDFVLCYCDFVVVS